MQAIGFEDDIIAIKQVDNLTVIQTAATDIVIRKAIDEVTILDIENALSGNVALADELVIQQWSDDIVIHKPADEELTNK